MITKITNWLRNVFSSPTTVSVVEDPTETIYEVGEIEVVVPTTPKPTPKITETIVPAMPVAAPSEPTNKKRGRKPKYKNKKQ